MLSLSCVVSAVHGRYGRAVGSSAGAPIDSAASVSVLQFPLCALRITYAARLLLVCWFARTFHRYGSNMSQEYLRTKKNLKVCRCCTAVPFVVCGLHGYTSVLCVLCVLCVNNVTVVVPPPPPPTRTHARARTRDGPVQPVCCTPASHVLRDYSVSPCHSIETERAFGGTACVDAPTACPLARQRWLGEGRHHPTVAHTAIFLVAAVCSRSTTAERSCADFP